MMWPIDRPLNDLRASCQQQIVSDISAAATRQALGTVFVLLTCSPISLQNYQCGELLKLAINFFIQLLLPLLISWIKVWCRKSYTFKLVFIHWTDGAEDQNNDILSYNGTESSKFLYLTSPYED